MYSVSSSSVRASGVGLTAQDRKTPITSLANLRRFFCVSSVELPGPPALERSSAVNARQLWNLRCNASVFANGHLSAVVFNKFSQQTYQQHATFFQCRQSSALIHCPARSQSARHGISCLRPKCGKEDSCYNTPLLS